MERSYSKLMVMVGIHFLIMFFLTYALANSLDDIYVNINRAYMAGIMISPMIVLMLIFMDMKYYNSRLNIILYMTATAFFVAFFTFARSQTFVGDRQFLRSMIPHHSSAILMCANPKITDPEIKALCENIMKSQQSEIDQMRSILNRLGD